MTPSEEKLRNLEDAARQLLAADAEWGAMLAVDLEWTDSGCVSARIRGELAADLMHATLKD